MKIALGQIEVFPGDCEETIAQMLDFIDQAKRQDVDLVAFPELVFGYLLGDRFRDLDFCRELMRWNEVIRKASKGISVAFGNVFVDETKVNKDGRFRLYNAAYIYTDGVPATRIKHDNHHLPAGITFKTNLPCYRFFDEPRFFFSMTDLYVATEYTFNYYYIPFTIPTKYQGDMLVGFELCEDLWCQDYSYWDETTNHTKTISPAKEFKDNGAGLIINLSASPWTHGKNAARDRRVKELALGVPYYYVNCTGVQNSGKNIVTFDGGSTIYNKVGEPVAFAEQPYKTELIIPPPLQEAIPKSRNKSDPIQEKYQAIITGIRHIKDILGLPCHPKIIIGLSGGVDSAVSAAIVADAIGKEHVIGINIPTHNNTQKTKDAADELALNLRIEYRIIPITKILKAIEEATGRFEGLINENDQARIRGANILAGIAARENGLFINNGNKVEFALGYCTAYGDLCGCVAVLGDLLKTEIYEMAQYVNILHGRDIIPRRLLPDNDRFEFSKEKIQSGPELQEGQVTQLKIGYHDCLVSAMTDYKKITIEDILEWYAEGTLEDHLQQYGMTPGMLQRYDISDPETFLQDIEWFVSKFQSAIWKRIQSPPIIVLSKTAFGNDLRESQMPFRKSAKYKAIETKIKQKLYATT